jgi:peptide/nickel transport system substrate-binding protein
VRRVWGVVLAVALAAVAGCGPAGPAPLAGNATFVMRLLGDPGNLNPLRAITSDTQILDSFAYDNLIYQTESGVVLPGVARAWKASARSVTFTLRAGVTCSDGAKLTASDVAAVFNWVKNPKNHSDLPGVFLPAAYTMTSDNAAGTVTITTARPYSFLLVGAGAVPLVCPRGLASPALLAHHTDGTGPYVLTSAQPGVQYTLKARKGYAWGPGGAATAARGIPSTVVMKVVPNETTAANLLESGELNAATLIGPDRHRLDPMASLFKMTVSTNPGEMFFNEKPGHPGNDPAVRRALTMALNRAEVGRVATGGLGHPPTGLVTIQPKPCSGNTTQKTPAYNPTAAKAQLRSAGWAQGPGQTRARHGKPLALTVVYPTSVGDQLASAMELLAQQWKAAGATTTLQGQTDDTLQRTLFGTGNWDAAWFPAGPNLPSQLIGVFTGPTPPTGTNFASVSNPTYAKDTTTAIAMPGTTGCPLWNAAEQALYSNSDVIPIINNTETFYGHNATFQVVNEDIVPTSIRMHTH